VDGHVRKWTHRTQSGLEFSMTRDAYANYIRSEPNPGQKVPSSRKAPNHGGDSEGQLLRTGARRVRPAIVMDSRPTPWARWPTIICETKVTLAMAPSVHT